MSELNPFDVDGEFDKYGFCEPIPTIITLLTVLGVLAVTFLAFSEVYK